jgi:hypothetical protein
MTVFFYVLTTKERKFQGIVNAALSTLDFGSDIPFDRRLLLAASHIWFLVARIKQIWNVTLLIVKMKNVLRFSLDAVGFLVRDVWLVFVVHNYGSIVTSLRPTYTLSNRTCTLVLTRTLRSNIMKRKELSSKHL